MTNESGPGESRSLTVGEVASLAGVTVRTLHHWDAVNLVSPSERTHGGFRLYSAADIARIHRVLIYRELGLSLSAIATLLNAPSPDPAGPLVAQRAQLVDRIEHLQGMVAVVERMIDAANTGILLSAEKQIALFGPHWQPSWPTEAKNRWGDNAQWAEYAERAAGMTADDWREVADLSSALSEDLSAAKRAGVSAGSTEANVLAERHRASISIHFHCSHSMQVCIARTYVDDAEFASHYDALEPGLARWLRDVIDANARDHGVDPESARWI